MKIWNDCLISSIRCSIAAAVFAVLCSPGIYAQLNTAKAEMPPQTVSYFELMLRQQESKELPRPKTVMKRSLMVPGWGQLTNKQAWKIPIVYGLLGGLGYYSVFLTKEYHGYRAAYYNSFPENTDLRFGSTPAALEGASASFLKNQRDFLRNRRDFIYITIALAYVLNVVDAYVFAHLRSFDVSDDLSLNTYLKPEITGTAEFAVVPALTLKLEFNR